VHAMGNELAFDLPVAAAASLAKYR